MNRRPELDLARTIAILCMVIYHLAFDLSQFYGWDIDVLNGPWLIFARATAILFLLISGISSALSLSHGTDWRKQLRRFAKIGGAALLVSLATYISNPDTFVRFGILHLIAVAGLLLPFIAPLKKRTIIAGFIAIALGFWTRTLITSTPLLLPFGIRPIEFHSVDYFPLLPWMGVILIGYGIGYFFYARKIETGLEARSSLLEAIALPGRYSLSIYLIHQPLILGILWLILGRPNF